MRIARWRAATFLFALGFTTACGGGSSHAGGGASIAASTSSGVGGVNSNAINAVAAIGTDYAATWTVKGTDSVYGDYEGTAVVQANAPGYSIQRLVTFKNKLPDGRDLVQGWNATATRDPAGLAVHVSVQRGDAFKSIAGKMARTAADLQPLVLDVVLAGANGQAPAAFGPATTIAGVFSAATTTHQETWTYAPATTAPTFPVTYRTRRAIHTSNPTAKQSMFAVYGPYHQLPQIKPYVGRPEFQAAIHYARVDRTAKEWYRTNAQAVLVLDKVLDEIAIAEETQRANAFSKKLFEKARQFDADMTKVHIDATGMCAIIDQASRSRWVSGDCALFQGIWVASQVYRWNATKDPEAMKNVETGLKALCLLVDVTPNKSEFARAVRENVPPLQPNFVPGTGAFANVAYLPGGNNDMLHGIEYGFVAAESILPAGHPLRAEIARCALSLLDNVSIAKSGTHQIFLSYASWKASGDPARESRYKNSLTDLKNVAQQAWIAAGNGMVQVEGITDWSGHHLGQCTFLGLRFLGGSSPNLAETGWKVAGETGARVAFSNLRECRLGLLSYVAGAVKAPGASDLAKEIMDELPYPKPSTNGASIEIDTRCAGDFCMSPYPSAPWKLDWMQGGREQAIEGRPMFHRGGMDNCWNSEPMFFTGGQGASLWPGHDFLHAYWFARMTNQIGPQD